MRIYWGILPHWGVFLEPRSLFAVGSSFPCVSSSATPPQTGCIRGRTWTPCTGTWLCPKCSLPDAYPPVNCWGLRCVRTDIQIQIRNHTQCPCVIIDIKTIPTHTRVCRFFQLKVWTGTRNNYRDPSCSPRAVSVSLCTAKYSKWVWVLSGKHLLCCIVR